MKKSLRWRLTKWVHEKRKRDQAQLMIRKRDRSTRSFYDNIKENAQGSINKKKLILEKKFLLY